MFDWVDYKIWCEDNGLKESDGKNLCEFVMWYSQLDLRSYEELVADGEIIESEVKE